MENTRQQKFARLIQKELAELFQREGKTYTGNALLTLTEVRVSPDLSVAKIYVSIFPPAVREATFENLRAKTFEVRKLLGARIRHQARVVPELIFYLDNTLDEADRIEQLLKK